MSRPSASRRPSPSKFHASTVSAIAAPGGTDKNGLVASTPRASAKDRPQLGSLTGTPTPRKLRPASIKITAPNSNEVCTMSGGAIFGRMCLKIMVRTDKPPTRALSTYSSSRSASITPRERRAKRVDSTAPTAIMAFSRPFPSTAITPKAMRIPGIENTTSTTHITPRSKRPPMKPDSNPMGRPKIIAMETPRMDACVEIRVP